MPNEFGSEQIGAHTIFSDPMGVSGNLPSVIESTNSFFLILFFHFSPSLPPNRSCSCSHLKGSQKEGQVLKEFHESPEGEAFLVSVNFTEHQRRNVVDKNSFTKSQRGNRFWPASVSRNNKERNVLDDDSFMKSPRGKRF